MLVFGNYKEGKIINIKIAKIDYNYKLSPIQIHLFNYKWTKAKKVIKLLFAGTI